MSSDSLVQGLFKQVYGELRDLKPKAMKFQEMWPQEKGNRQGSEFVEAMILSFETGFTLMGNENDTVDINSPVAGAVKQAKIKDYGTIVASNIPFPVLVRAAESGEQAFKAASKHVTKNNLESHQRLIEVLCWHGQAAGKLGRVSYLTGTYRGVSFTNGAGTLNGVTFATGGVDTSNKYILLERSFASGIYSGMEGCPIQEVTSADAVVASGAIVAVESEYGYLKVDFTPVAASSTSSHALAFPGMASQKDMVGVNKILTNTGSLFEIDASQYSLWRGTTVALDNKKLTFDRISAACGKAVNRGGLAQDIDVFVNPLTWTTLLSDQAALVRHTGDTSTKVKMGSETIEFYSQNGKITIHPHPVVKENEAYGLARDDWHRIGSQDLGFKVNGAGELIFPLQNQTAWRFESFAMNAVYCSAPARSFYISGIDNESST